MVRPCCALGGLPTPMRTWTKSSLRCCTSTGGRCARRGPHRPSLDAADGKVELVVHDHELVRAVEAVATDQLRDRCPRFMYVCGNVSTTCSPATVTSADSDLSFHRFSVAPPVGEKRYDFGSRSCRLRASFARVAEPTTKKSAAFPSARSRGRNRVGQPSSLPRSRDPAAPSPPSPSAPSPSSPRPPLPRSKARRSAATRRLGVERRRDAGGSTFSCTWIMSPMTIAETSIVNDVGCRRASRSTAR